MSPRFVITSDINAGETDLLFVNNTGPEYQPKWYQMTSSGKNLTLGEGRPSDELKAIKEFVPNPIHTLIGITARSEDNPFVYLFHFQEGRTLKWCSGSGKDFTNDGAQRVTPLIVSILSIF